VTQAGSAADIPVPRAPAFFEFNGEHIAADARGVLSSGWQVTKQQHSWYYRAQNFVVGITWLSAGEALAELDIPDEHILLILNGSSVDVVSGANVSLAVDGAALVVVPAGASRIVGRDAGYIVRVFSSRAADVVTRALNSDAYATLNPAVRGLASETMQRKPAAVRVHLMRDVPDDPERLGRIFRTDTLMINWYAAEIGPRDTNRLTPHSHDDFEQATVTFGGEYVHHIRRPWSARLEDWRADEHVQVHSPSVTIIPPGNVHTTRAVGDGVHHLIDVFGPTRSDFIERGWVLNQTDYENEE
jgi:mannose-6-phosphate isomerase-like protein (cupin superfamily)